MRTRGYDFAKDRTTQRGLPLREKFHAQAPQADLVRDCVCPCTGLARSAQEKSIVVASTTSTQDSGLFDFILPLFKQKSGIDVKVVALGTGQALDMARRGNADEVFVHAKEAEEKFVAEGFGLKRNSVMYNDFVISGSKNDSAGIKGSRYVTIALQILKPMGAPSSHAATSPVRILRKSISGMPPGIDIEKEAGPWYKSIGQGMGAALKAAATSKAYVMSDRGTWISFKDM
jgi:tungstate transport system substrate-binding protein